MGNEVFSTGIWREAVASWLSATPIYFQADPITHPEATFTHSLCLLHALRIYLSRFVHEKVAKREYVSSVLPA